MHLPTPASTSSPRSIVRKIIRKVTTKEGLVGDYDYAYLFTPAIPYFSRNKKPKNAMFFSLNSEMPLLLGFVLGLQHSLSMLAGIITPPIIIASAANLDEELKQYLVSASLITSGLLSMIQITRFHIWGTKYYVGTGLISVVGTSFATISVVTNVFPMMYSNGYCPVAEDGTKLACPDGYGAIIATSCICGLLEVLLSFIPPAALQKIFPPIVTGPVVLLIGVSLIQSGFEDWAGGSGCMGSVCPSETAPKPLPWGSAQFIGLGFLVFVTIIVCEKWGAPIMKSCAVVCGLLMGCIVASACGYFDRSGIDVAPVATFMWVHTFRLKLYGPIVLPLLSVYIILMMEAIGDITATCDVSRLDVEGEEYESRIQGGVLADGFNGILAGLCTLTPMSTFAQNNGIISLTKCANRTVGYWCCFFLIVMGIFSKFAAALVSIPSAVLGGMTTFLFTSVAVSGLRIIAIIPFTRRDRFVLTCSCLFGFGSVLVPDWFSYVFTYSGSNESLTGFLDAIILLMEQCFAVAGLVGVIINLIIPQQSDDEDITEEVEGETPFSGIGDLEVVRSRRSEKAATLASTSEPVSGVTGSAES